MESFLLAGFRKGVTKSGEEFPICIECEKSFKNSVMKKNHLLSHQLRAHPASVGQNENYFKQILHQKGILPSQIAVRKALLTASYILAELTAKTAKSHTTGERLVKPFLEKLVELPLKPEEYKDIPISNSSIKRRTVDLANYYEKELISRLLNAGKFAIQLDETTDVENGSQLIVICRYRNEGTIAEDMLFCRNLETTTTGKDVYFSVNQYFLQKGLLWSMVVAICTDGAAPMVGEEVGLRGILKTVAPHIYFVHCSIHREALSARCLPDELENIVDISSKVVNYLKQAKNSRVFKKFCEEQDADYLNVLFYTKSRWLSRGKFLQRLYILRLDVKRFLTLQKIERKLPKDMMKILVDFENPNFQRKLGYLCDIFDKLNILNLSLQGNKKELTIFDAYSHISGMRETLIFLEEKVKKLNFQNFENLNCLLGEKDVDIRTDMSATISKHIRLLVQSFDKYFPDLDLKNNWVVNPFRFESNNLPKDLKPQQEEEILRIKCDVHAQGLYTKMGLKSFWFSMEEKYPALFESALDLLLAFATTYSCEKAFSTLLLLKSKNRNRLEVEADLRINLNKNAYEYGEIIK